MPHQFTMDEIRLVRVDGVPTWKVRCPGCGMWGYADEEQMRGSVSLQCGAEGCAFHETHDLSTLMEEVRKT